MAKQEVEASPFERHSAEVQDAIRRGRAAFEDLGAALRACKESASWREKYASWTEACKSEWGISRQHAHRLIQGVKITDLLRASPVGDKSKNQDEPEPPKSLPVNERTARELSGVPENKVPEIANRASEMANGEPPTSAHIREAKAEVLPNEPERPPDVGEDEEPDPYEEIESLLRENRRLSELVDQITESDTDAALAKLSERYARLEGRVSQLAQTTKQAEGTAKYATGMLRKIRSALGVERDRDILPAIEAAL